MNMESKLNFEILEFQIITLNNNDAPFDSTNWPEETERD